MKQIYFLLLTLATVYLSSCSNSPTEKAQSSVKDYLKNNLKNPDSYVAISFSKIDTFSVDYEKDKKSIEESFKDNKELRDKYLAELKESLETPYSIKHFYSVVNSDKDKVQMSVRFTLDKELKVVEKSVTKSINGECGSLAGVVYWKYNDYVGNKPDIGSEITLYSRDTIRDNLKYETNVDAQGNYKIEKVLPGRYLLIVQSKNATDCPEKHIKNLIRYSEEIKQLFDFDIYKYKTQLDEIHKIDSIASVIISDKTSKYGGASSQLDKYYSTQKESRDIAEKLIESFPNSFTSKIGIYTGYSYALDISLIWIEETKTENKNTDFGITCI
jgi:hypothetical protein